MSDLMLLRMSIAALKGSVAFELLASEEYNKVHQLLVQDKVPDSHQESMLDELRMLATDYSDNWEGFVESDGEEQAHRDYQMILRCVGILEYLLL